MNHSTQLITPKARFTSSMFCDVYIFMIALILVHTLLRMSSPVYFKSHFDQSISRLQWLVLSFILASLSSGSLSLAPDCIAQYLCKVIFTGKISILSVLSKIRQFLCARIRQNKNYVDLEQQAPEEGEQQREQKGEQQEARDGEREIEKQREWGRDGN